MLRAGSLEVQTSNTDYSSSSTENDEAQKETSVSSETGGNEQGSSSTRASMTLNSSPLEEMDEIEEYLSGKSSPTEKPSLVIGSFELIQLRAAAHYGKIFSYKTRYRNCAWIKCQGF